MPAIGYLSRVLGGESSEGTSSRIAEAVLRSDSGIWYMCEHGIYFRLLADFIINFMIDEPCEAVVMRAFEDAQIFPFFLSSLRLRACYQSPIRKVASPELKHLRGWTICDCSPRMGQRK